MKRIPCGFLVQCLWLRGEQDIYICMSLGKGTYRENIYQVWL